MPAVLDRHHQVRVGIGGLLLRPAQQLQTTASVVRNVRSGPS
jgi:hypothetical protein